MLKDSMSKAVFAVLSTNFMQGPCLDGLPDLLDWCERRNDGLDRDDYWGGYLMCIARGYFEDR